MASLGKKMTYCRHCGAELSKDDNFCSNCGARIIQATEHIEKHHVLNVAGKPKVTVTNIVPGSIKVESGSDSEVKVDLDLRVPEHLECNISQDKNDIKVICRVKTGFRDWPSYIFRTGPRANILISVPSEADLDLENRAGRIGVFNVKGDIVAESSAGSINFKECKGTIKTRTRAGSVNFENVDGTVIARSSAGSLKFSGALSEGENWFRTSVGSINISLHEQPNLTVEAVTNLGSIRCIPELTDAYHRRGHYTGRIGVGKGRLIAETRTGSITIQH
jgi:hypothetical protein